LAGAPAGVTSMLSTSVSLTGLQELSWQMTNFASQVMAFCPASVASKGMSKRALSEEKAPFDATTLRRAHQR
jgi:hypothetical protein